MTFTIDPMQSHDWSQVRAIYQDGLAAGLAAFMLTPPTWSKWDTGHLSCGRLVARRGDLLLGWGALAAVADA